MYRWPLRRSEQVSIMSTDGSAKAVEHYFARFSHAVNLSAPEGLRRGQRAAIHALTGHLTLKSEPAIAVLPTGAGKTDVAILLPYVLKVSRVLFVVPSDSVRSLLRY